MNLGLEGKRALITGSTRGIGATIAAMLADEGVKVVIHGRNADAARDVAAKTGKPDNVAVVIGDLADPASADRVADEALAAFGGIDIFVNNAAISRMTTWDDIKPQEWIDLYAVNVAPAVRLSAKFAPLMGKRGWGRIIHMGSTAAALGMPLACDYAATKAALASVSSSLSKHFGEVGVTSNILGVGTIGNLVEYAGFTQATDEANKGSKDPVYDAFLGLPFGHLHVNTLKRTGTPKEVAFVVCMLASPLSGFINGAVIRVDGGTVPSVAF